MKMKLKMLGTVFVSSLLFACGNVEDSARIPECESIPDNSACKSCCQDEGWDTGTYLSTENVCECIDKED